jgi:hypothetical protein
MPSTSAHVAHQFCPLDLDILTVSPITASSPHRIGHRSASGDCTCFVVAGWRIPVGSPPFDSKPRTTASNPRPQPAARSPLQPNPTTARVEPCEPRVGPHTTRPDLHNTPPTATHPNCKPLPWICSIQAITMADNKMQLEDCMWPSRPLGICCITIRSPLTR